MIPDTPVRFDVRGGDTPRPVGIIYGKTPHVGDSIWFSDGILASSHGRREFPRDKAVEVARSARLRELTGKFGGM